MGYRQKSPLPIINGGTNTETLANANGTIVYDGTSLVTISPGTSGFVLTSAGAGTNPAYAAVTTIGVVTSVATSSGTATPSSGVITFTGAGDIATSGSGSTVTLTGSGATSLVSDSGTATVSSNSFTIAGGTGITTSATGSTVTITATGGGSGIYPFTDVTGATQAMAVDTGYVSNNGATLVTFTLPSTAAVGTVIAVQGAGTGLFTIAQNAGQSISFNGGVSTVGVGGSVSSSGTFDSIYLMCITADTVWAANNTVGNFNVV